MPTPTGLPKTGEVWELQVRVMGKAGPTSRFVVLSRTRDSYWAMRTASRRGGEWVSQLRVDCAYHLKMRELRYVGPVGEISRAELVRLGWLQ